MKKISKVSEIYCFGTRPFQFLIVAEGRQTQCIASVSTVPNRRTQQDLVQFMTVFLAVARAAPNLGCFQATKKPITMRPFASVPKRNQGSP
jgi:hypothetical protein